MTLPAPFVPDYAQNPLLAHTGGLLRPGGLALTDRLISLAGLDRGSWIADLACGSGASVLHVRQQHGMHVCGVDVSMDLLQKTPGLPLFLGNAMNLPLRSRSMDAVLCECAFCLMPDPQALLTEVNRVLRPGGALLLSDVYVRTPPARLRPKPTLGPTCCVDGARVREELEALFHEHALPLDVWEDHTPMLTQLAAELVFAHGSLQAFWETFLPPNRACAVSCQGKSLKLGYYIAIARSVLP